MKNAEHVLVAINEEGEHEIIFVSNDIKEINHRAMSFTDECFVYSCGVKAYHEALHTMNDVPSPSRQLECLVIPQRQKYAVKSIKPQETHEWILKKHYAGRLPSISYAFGIYSDVTLVGILTIGKPASPYLCNGVCGKEYAEYVYELNRLCINDDVERNTLSYFVGRTLRILRENLILVSYADTQWGHHGYIYQATNWIYTGATKERTDIGQEDGTHSRHYDKGLDYSANRKFRSAKHRYIYFLGKRAKEFRKNLKYEVMPYPKGNNKRYDSSYLPNAQMALMV